MRGEGAAGYARRKENGQLAVRLRRSEEKKGVLTEDGRPGGFRIFFGWVSVDRTFKKKNNNITTE